MKVIIISDALDEPYEMDSDKDKSVMGFGYIVSEKVDAVFQTEKMKYEHTKHGIFGR